MIHTWIAKKTLLIRSWSSPSQCWLSDISIHMQPFWQQNLVTMELNSCQILLPRFPARPSEVPLPVSEWLCFSTGIWADTLFRNICWFVLILYFLFGDQSWSKDWAKQWAAGALVAGCNMFLLISWEFHFHVPLWKTKYLHHCKKFFVFACASD